MKINILAFGAHPDDVELGAGGTLITQKQLGYSTGIVDLTEGEMGTRGTISDRRNEASEAAKILGLDVRENLGFPDGKLENSLENQLAVIRAIRQYQPDVLLINAPNDRHPDHGKAATLLLEGAFKAGLRMLETHAENGQPQAAWRPAKIYHYIQFYPLKPDFVLDISPVIELKMQAIRAYKTQFYDPHSDSPETLIAGKHFLDIIQSRALDLGHQIQSTYGEGFIAPRVPGVKNLFDLK
jgi:bacillithiol biosynthesis deacetylase BshB1